MRTFNARQLLNRFRRHFLELEQHEPPLDTDYRAIGEAHYKRMTHDITLNAEVVKFSEEDALHFFMDDIPKDNLPEESSQKELINASEDLPSKLNNMIDSGETLYSAPIIQPPLNAEFLLHLLLRHDEHDAIIGDLIERYGKKHARLGTRRANFWFYAEVFWTALPLIKRAFLKISGMVTLVEFVRRHIS